MAGASDLIRLGELLKIAAETAADIASALKDGDLSRVVDCAKRLNETADVLIEVGEELAQQPPKTSH